MRNHTFTDRAFGRDDYDPDDQGSYEEGLVFVMMPFTSENSQEIFNAIHHECMDLSLRATCVDEASGSGFVIGDITSLIERAEFIVCDLSDERPNVYYELGYAHGCGNESDDILLVAKTGTRLHFDISPLRVHYYEHIAALRLIVRKQITRMISATRR